MRRGVGIALGTLLACLLASFAFSSTPLVGISGSCTSGQFLTWNGAGVSCSANLAASGADGDVLCNESGIIAPCAGTTNITRQNSPPGIQGKAGNSALSATVPACGRLTLTTGVPVTTSDVTGATTIYYTAYQCSTIGLYNGTSWVPVEFTEISKAVGTLTSGKPYDVFVYSNSGTATIDTFVVWTNDTTRATALAYVNGTLVKSGDTTRRYVGTFYTTATTTTEDSEQKRYLWNNYNRVLRNLAYGDTSHAHTYNNTATQQWNNSTVNQVNFVSGVAEDGVAVILDGDVTNSTTALSAFLSLQIDAVNTETALMTQGPASARLIASTAKTFPPQLGRHFVAATERCGAGTCTFTSFGLLAYLRM